MSSFVNKIVEMLSRKGFIDFPTRRRGLRSTAVVMANDGNLILVLGSFNPRSSSSDKSDIQREFDDYLNRDILPIVEYYEKGFGLRSVKIVMQSGGFLELKSRFGLRGIEVITGLEAEEISIDVPGIGTLSL